MRKAPLKQNPKLTSWEPESKWYKTLVGEEGHYYHQHIILPGILQLLDLQAHPSANLLDLACGTGVLARHLPNSVHYTGIDLSSTFIKAAKKEDSHPHHHYFVGDITKSLPLQQQQFSHATIILALQNLQHSLQVFQNAHKYLLENGVLIIVLNHPCFRIPRQSFWQIDDAKKLQYRRVDRYFSPLEIPILAHPSKGKESTQLISYHYPISSYFHWLKKAGFIITDIEEWCSNKQSLGTHAKMENRSRSEFPLFLTICASKI